MRSYDVIILTDARYVNPESRSEYVQNILKEDKLVSDALTARGLRVDRLDWNDPHFNWSDTGSVLFRTTWDYFDRFDRFREWLSTISGETKLINSTDIISWNMDKHYLQDLGKKGTRIIPTRYIKKGSSYTLAEWHELTGWDETVIKPCVGGAGRYTYHLKKEDLPRYEEQFSEWIRHEDFMLQPFQHQVALIGEWSLMFFGDRYSHAVLKKAKKGDFRVQDDFGGTVHPVEPGEELISFAREALKAAPGNPAYARVDVIRGNDGLPALSELELIEPELWFRNRPEAAGMLADEVEKRI